MTGQWFTFEPTPEQRAALVMFKDRYGRTWKSKLCEMWFHGAYPAKVKDIEGYLQQVRNQGGPSWLNRFRLVPRRGDR
jgi:hypothetical protein